MSSVHEHARPAILRPMWKYDWADIQHIDWTSTDKRWDKETWLKETSRPTAGMLVASWSKFWFARVVAFNFFYVNETELVVARFATQTEDRRRGVASQLLKKVDSVAKRTAFMQRMMFGKPLSRIRCVVPEENVAAQCTLRSCGYRAIKSARDEDNQRDVYVFEKPVV